MPKHSTIIGLGILIAVMPFLGFTPFIKDIFFVMAGLVVAIIAYFSNVQYCNNCRKIIENGKNGIPNTEQRPVGGGVSEEDINGLST